MNFSLRHLDVCCEAYSYFRRCLSQLLELQEPRCSFRVEQLPTANLAQFFLYERVEQLVRDERRKYRCLYKDRGRPYDGLENCSGC